MDSLVFKEYKLKCATGVPLQVLKDICVALTNFLMLQGYIINRITSMAEQLSIDKLLPQIANNSSVVYIREGCDDLVPKIGCSTNWGTREKHVKKTHGENTKLVPVIYCNGIFNEHCDEIESIVEKLLTSLGCGEELPTKLQNILNHSCPPDQHMILYLMNKRGHDYLKKGFSVRCIESAIQFSMRIGDANTSIHEFLGSNKKELELNIKATHEAVDIVWNILNLAETHGSIVILPSTLSWEPGKLDSKVADGILFLKPLIHQLINEEGYVNP